MKKILYIFITTIFLASCSSFLEREPSTSLSTEIAIETVDDLHNAINGVYYLVSGGECQYGGDLSLYGDALGPDNKVIGGSNHGVNNIARRIIGATDNFTQLFYETLYKGLANVNYILSVIDNLEGDELAGYKAELMGLRGLFHFELLRLYAQIPTSGSTSTLGIVLSTEVYPINYVGERMTLDASYAQVIADFTTAINSGLNKAASVGHMNYWAALALRARAYLYMGEYANALADSKEIIANDTYKLYSISEYVGVWKKVGTAESILEITQNDQYNAQRAAIGYMTNPEGYAEAAVNETFYDMLVLNPKDIRSRMVTKRGDPDKEDKHLGYYGLKFTGQEGMSNRWYANSPKVIRLSEVYFIAAEAELKVGTASGAAGYINAVRTKRITDYVSVATVTITDILNERRKELFNEGQIAFDYWRNQISFASEFFTDATPYVLPIPQREIDIAGDILVQNP